MASGILKAGVDLDTLFMARVNAKRADVGWRVGGTDISNRYEPIGTGTAIAATGHKSGGTELASLFRNISEALGPVVSISNRTVTSTMAGQDAFADYALDNVGDIQGCQGNNTMVDIGDWITPKPGSAAYSCMGVTVSGSGAGTMNTWLTLNAIRIWEAQKKTTAGTSTWVVDISIRRNSDNVVLSTARITMTATRT